MPDQATPHVMQPPSSQASPPGEGERYRTLLEINNAIISHLTPEPLFHAVAQALRRVFPIGRSAIFLHDPEKDVLRLFMLESSLPSQYFRVGLEMPPGDSHVGWVFQHRKPLLRRDLERERQYPLEDRALADGVRSYVIVPLIARKKTVGTLAVASTNPNQYDEADAVFLQEAASQVALAVENMQTYKEIAALNTGAEKAAARSRTLLEINNAIISSLTQEDLFRAIAQALRHVIPSDRTAIFLHDPQKDVLKLFVLDSSLPSEHFVVGWEEAPQKSSVGWVFQHRQPFLRRDLDTEREFPTEDLSLADGVRSYMVVPLIVRGTCVGTLGVASATPNQYSGADIVFLQEAANQVAMAVQNMKAYEEAKQEVTLRRQAEEMLRSIMEGTAAVTGVDFFQSLVRHLAAALRVRYALVTECRNPMKTRVRTLAFWDGEGFGENFEYDLAETPCQAVLNGSLSYHPRDLQRLFPRDRYLAEFGAESFVGIPMLDSTGQVIGHLAVLDDKPMEQVDRGVAILKIFAARAGAELERHRASEEVHRLNLEQEVMLGINRAIGRHLDRDQLFGALSACLRTVVPTEFFGIELPIEGDKLQGHLLAAHHTDTGAERTQPTVLPAAGTACNWVMQNRELIITASRDESRERFPVTFDVMAGRDMESLCALPLLSGNRCRGALFFMAAAKGAYQGLDRGFLEQVASAVAVALDDCLAHEELRQLRDRLAAENIYLQEEIRREHDFVEMVGNSPALLAVLRKVEQVAPTDSTVLISGETGTGKELIARAIHSRSRRKDRPLVKVDCSAISAGLVESELFGHMKGAFTGAIERRTGRFEVADGGTIFLDEVGELPPETQAKLLRVLQEGDFEPVGSSKTVRVNVRVIAATNRDLEEAVRAGRFRSDLFYRLNVFPLEVPPLRERRSDIPQLVMFFLARFAKRFGRQIETVSQDTMDRLVNYAWPGNVRELQNVIERASVLSQGSVLELDRDLVPPPPSGDRPETGSSRPQVAWSAVRGRKGMQRPAGPGSAGLASLGEIERNHILAVLRQTGGVIEGPRGAAKVLDLHPNTLRSRMQKLGIKRTSHEIS